MSIIAMIMVISVALLFVYVITVGVSYSTHRDMVKTSTREYGYGTFEDFKREFEKRRWTHKPVFYDSLFGENDGYGKRTQIHASIIQFDGKGMIMKNALEYMQVKLYMSEALRKIRSNNLVDWSNSQNMEVNKIDFQKKTQ